MAFDDISVNNEPAQPKREISRLEAVRSRRAGLPELANLTKYLLVGLVGMLAGIGLYLTKDSLLGGPPTQRYVDKLDKFSFQFVANKYDLDASLESTKRYGRDYLVGFKEKTDPRIGCEVRRRGLTLDINRSLATIQQELMATPSGTIKFVTTAGKKAVRLDMDITDPLGAVVTINQVYLPMGSQTYLLQCGAGKAYFDKFAPDFELFFTSFAF